MKAVQTKPDRRTHVWKTWMNFTLLNNFKVSHLLWAADLVLLPLDPTSLQKLLDGLYEHAERRELFFNISKHQ